MLEAIDAPPRLTVAEFLADKLGPHKYNTWFKNSTQFHVVGNCVRVTTPNHFVGEWIERHFSDVIVDACREVFRIEPTLSFAIDAKLAKGIGKKQPDRQVDFIANNPERVARMTRRNGSVPAMQNLRGRLDEFICGPSNRMAFSACLCVVENPAAQYNPLFVHGGCGLGKTHLLQGIYNDLRVKFPDRRARYVSGEEFTNDYVCAVKSREDSVFRDRYRNLDVLIIDDVHFLANKRATQDEFLNTLKALDASGKQLVLASDAHPRHIGHFSEALVSRFVSGMVVRVDSPDFEVRSNVLRKRAEKLGADIPERVILFIAERYRTNIRELDGALIKIVGHAHAEGQSITLELAERAIRDLVRVNGPVIILSDVESVVAIQFGLSPADLHTSRKSRTIALARGIAMYLARKHTHMSFPEIGRFMGNKNHTTVLLAHRRISRMLQSDVFVTWQTPSGPRNANLATLIAQLEEQVGIGVIPEAA